MECNEEHRKDSEGLVRECRVGVNKSRQPKEAQARQGKAREERARNVKMGEDLLKD